jgi:hypothetical protein
MQNFCVVMDIWIVGGLHPDVTLATAELMKDVKAGRAAALPAIPRLSECTFPSQRQNAERQKRKAAEAVDMQPTPIPPVRGQHAGVQ